MPESTSGTVRAFDPHRGAGLIVTDEGVELSFHCAAIADGTRSVEIGDPVTFKVISGTLGRWEAWDIRPLVSSTSFTTQKFS